MILYCLKSHNKIDTFFGKKQINFPINGNEPKKETIMLKFLKNLPHFEKSFFGHF